MVALADEVCRGCEDARRFVEKFVVWAHVIDDVIDRDVPLPPVELFVRLQLEMALEFADNPFFQEHREGLLAIMEMSARAYVDSLTWAADADINRRRAADVLKSEYQNVLWYVARCVGGLGHQELITRRWRHYQFDAQ